MGSIANRILAEEATTTRAKVTGIAVCQLGWRTIGGRRMDSHATVATQTVCHVRRSRGFDTPREGPELAAATCMAIRSTAGEP
ncbi:hypothetical protein PGTUg99_036355 [Puccinia graminis f. sp. tritici]|uniref:Uncharacterized protein n=1 Tax=Puccinia graminis f. sp. tritici TaxID=56615 RepID=A0A5B0SJ74_PUCGR|nr:hypothetical protein PGTUg99_036355 [Puccinia graminis f. sp. tritici]